jgi:hypothetical protein
VDYFLCHLLINFIVKYYVKLGSHEYMIFIVGEFLFNNFCVCVYMRTIIWGILLCCKIWEFLAFYELHWYKAFLKNLWWVYDCDRCLRFKLDILLCLLEIGVCLKILINWNELNINIFKWQQWWTWFILFLLSFYEKDVAKFYTKYDHSM